MEGLRTAVWLRFASWACAAGLVACGGGGGSVAGGSPAPAAVPASGTYAWLLRAEGPTSSLRFGLSLVHPDAPATEFVVEPTSAVVTDARVVASGRIDAATQQASALQPYALVYIVGGDVRRVALQANGRAPAAQVQRSATSSACSFQLEADDYANPEASRYVISTAGADGQCGTADDGRAEVRLDAALGLVVTPLPTDNLPLAAVRDPVNLSPRGWLGTRSLTLWSPASSVVPVRSAGSAAFDRVISASYRTALLESADGVSLVDLPGAQAFTEAPLPALGGAGWQGIGYDAASHYLYRNDGSGATGTWTLARVSRSAPAAATLASGVGQIAYASLGHGWLYLTVFSDSAHQLIAVDKAAGGAPRLLESLPTDALATVSTGRSGVHQLLRVTGTGSATIGYALEMIDEGFRKVYVADPGGFPIAQLEPTSIDFNASENRDRFLFATGYGAQGFSGAALVAFDAALARATSLGTLPGRSTYGADVVYANVVSGPTSSAAGFAARSVGGVIQGGDASVFSFDADVADSLRLATARQ